MTTEHLIEKAAKAIWFARHVGENVEWGELAWAEQTAPDDWASEALDALDAARAAFAVFEEAHTPTDDEREARLEYVIDAAVPVSEFPSWRFRYSRRIADAVRAAGFRRSEVPEPSAEDYPDAEGLAVLRSNNSEPQGEPSDAQVRAAAESIARDDGQRIDVVPEWADAYMPIARAALKAAFDVKGES